MVNSSINCESTFALFSLRGKLKTGVLTVKLRFVYAFSNIRDLQA